MLLVSNRMAPEEIRMNTALIAVQRRQLQEQVSDHTNQDDHHAGHQHPAKE